ncbi:hypothetical protein [Photobacterium damselae]|uniref:hypothetical protein n=1 Tax=Photobacterium damselae TaxID=38293 RepID=UPI001F3F8E01|nr:hypothetical protein [Photobacterium damselae]UKA29913.1 hypothetical protein IPQ37_04260 [Photobacterium damselae subsp. damselae]
MNIYSYHAFNSTGVGGVEALIRRFHFIFGDDFYEIYNECYGGEHFLLNGNKTKLRGSNSNLFYKIVQKISMYRFFSKVGKGNVIILYSQLLCYFYQEKS